MAKSGAGHRLAWKEKIDSSPWVDNAGWLDEGPQEQKSTDTSIEFLEAEPSAYRLSESPREKSPSVFSSTSARVLGLGAVAVVLLALALMSRPGDQDPFDQLPANKQQEILQRQNRQNVVPDTPIEEPQRSTDTTLPQPVPTPRADSAQADDEAGTDDGEPLGPIPELRADLSADMPDLLLAYGPAGSVVQIRRSDDQPTEIQVPSGLRPGTMLYSLFDERPLVLTDSTLLAVLPGGEVEAADVAAHHLLPGDGGVVLVSDGQPTRQVIISSRIGDGDGSLSLGYDVELLGAWQGRPLVYKAGAVWLLDDDGTAELVAEGVEAGYDGRNLFMVRCDRPDDCRIDVGPPDEPNRRSVPVPEQLADRPIDSWAPGAAVSPDGDRLAVVDRRGVALPRWIDLETGTATALSESVNEDSPVAWSPDGRWLAYAFGDDIIAWDTGDDRSWRIFVDRPISHMVWAEDTAGG